MTAAPRQDVLPFHGTINGHTTTDRRAWDGLVNTHRPALVEPFTRKGKPVRVKTVALPPAKPPRLFVAPRVSLTEVEKAWLGAEVTTHLRSAPGVWTVWSLGRLPKSVHLVKDGVALADVAVDALVRVTPQTTTFPLGGPGNVQKGTP